MKIMGLWFSNEMQWFGLYIWHQDSSPSNIHQGDMPYYDGGSYVWLAGR